MNDGGVASQLWRLEPEFAEALVEELADAQLLIADGHHRYETALAFHEEDGSEASAWLLAVIVPTGQEGLTIFPTHRVAQSAGGASGTPINPPLQSLPGPVLYRAGRYELLSSNGFLDPEVVDRFGPGGVTYTPTATRRSPRSTAARRRLRSCCVPPDRGRLGRGSTGRRDAAEEHVLLSQAHVGPLATAA